MEVQKLTQSFEKDKIASAEEILKNFIAFQIISTIAAKDNFFNIYNFINARTEKIVAYQSFITAFSSLFTSVKHNIKGSNRILEWETKEKKYQEFFEKNIEVTDVNMKKILELFDDFLEDLVKSGIYSLLEESSIGDEGWDEDEK